MQAHRSAEQIQDVNIRYHDVAAAGYDSKWGVDFGKTGNRQVLGKVGKLLGVPLSVSFPRALEIGAGTGYFGLNLLRAGVVDELTCSDISNGMLRALTDNAARLDLRVPDTVQADAERLPFPDASFDLVFGHATLHHIPDPERAFREFRRVLVPGGQILFAGEPSRLGDRIAQLPKLAAVGVAPLWRYLLRAGTAGAGTGVHAGQTPESHDHQLEAEVDVHAFTPAELERFATTAGFSEIRVLGEELLANWFGWFNRGLESTATPEDVPRWWRSYAFHGYLLLQRLDAAVLEPRLPPGLFYNLLLSARSTERPTTPLHR